MFPGSETMAGILLFFSTKCEQNWSNIVWTKWSLWLWYSRSWLNPHVTSSAKNLGFLFDSGLKFDHQQINSIIKSCFFHLRHLAKVKSFLSPKNFEIVIHAFITIVDYCNSLYLGAIHLSMGHLKLVQNAAARKVWSHYSDFNFSNLETSQELS